HAPSTTPRSLSSTVLLSLSIPSNNSWHLRFMCHHLPLLLTPSRRNSLTSPPPLIPRQHLTTDPAFPSPRHLRHPHLIPIMTWPPRSIPLDMFLLHRRPASLAALSLLRIWQRNSLSLSHICLQSRSA
ncbi:MAG: hypothetical protein M1830_004730, partial [Pleopsidium flavum]